MGTSRNARALGEAIADRGSDQALVMTAGVFDIEKAHSANNSSQLVSSGTEQSLIKKQYEA
jgi:hypothetical protein